MCFLIWSKDPLENASFTAEDDAALLHRAQLEKKNHSNQRGLLQILTLKPLKELITVQNT